MTRIWIAGRDAFARTIADWVRDVDRAGGELEIAGFVGMSAPTDGDRIASAPTYPNWEAAPIVAGDEVVLSVEAPGDRRAADAAIPAQLSRRTLIHPTAVVASHSVRGVGCLVGPKAVISTNVGLGRGVVVDALATVDHDVHVADYATLGRHADLCGSVVVGEDAWLAAHCSVIPSIVIGERTEVGIGSVVTRNCTPNSRFRGAPARQY